MEYFNYAASPRGSHALGLLSGDSMWLLVSISNHSSPCGNSDTNLESFQKAVLNQAIVFTIELFQYSALLKASTHFVPV